MSIESSFKQAERNTTLLAMATDIVSAYVVKNALPASDLPALIAQTHSSLAKLAIGAIELVVEPPKEPAVPVKKSVTNE